MKQERTLVLLKPDAVQKNISGKIIDRFESAGMKLIGMKLLNVSDELARKHYPMDKEWAKNLFERTKGTYKELGKPFGYDDHVKYGELIINWLCDFITEGPAMAMVLEGKDVVKQVRKLVGHTEPRQAGKGTIRGDFAPEESYKLADTEERAIRNLIHASDSIENARREIALWFSPEELVSN